MIAKGSSNGKKVGLSLLANLTTLLSSNFQYSEMTTVVDEVLLVVKLSKILPLPARGHPRVVSRNNNSSQMNKKNLELLKVNDTV